MTSEGAEPHERGRKGGKGGISEATLTLGSIKLQLPTAYDWIFECSNIPRA